jgi:protein SCO1
MMLTLTLSACGGAPMFHGVVRDQPLDVGSAALLDVTLPGARAGGVLDADGRLVMRAAEGRLLLVYFGFLQCPDVCPTTLADSRSALARLDDDERGRVDVVFVTVDPDRDGAEELGAYLRHFAPTHHALREPGVRLDAVLDAFLASAQVTVGPDGAIEVSHTAVLYAVDAQGHVVVEWPFGTSATALADDLRVLLARADGSARGAPARVGS